jgi:tellurite resistance protein TerC
MLMTDIYKLPIVASLIVIASLLAGSIVASILRPAPPAPLPPDPDDARAPLPALDPAPPTAEDDDGRPPSAPLAAQKR